MQKHIRKSLIFILLLVCGTCLAQTTHLFGPNSWYKVCFTPGQNCTQEIVDQINLARQSILVQAYSFTSKPIVNALVKAKQRGVYVKVILDKSQFRKHSYSKAGWLLKHNIPVLEDKKPRIAHNKIMIFDSLIVQSGSFNYSKSANKHNAENVIIIKDKNLAKQYIKNWQNRQKVSVKKSMYHSNRKHRS